MGVLPQTVVNSISTATPLEFLREGQSLAGIAKNPVPIVIKILLAALLAAIVFVYCRCFIVI